MIGVRGRRWSHGVRGDVIMGTIRRCCLLEDTSRCDGNGHRCACVVVLENASRPGDGNSWSTTIEVIHSLLGKALRSRTVLLLIRWAIAKQRIGLRRNAVLLLLWWRSIAKLRFALLSNAVLLLRQGEALARRTTHDDSIVTASDVVHVTLCKVLGPGARHEESLLIGAEAVHGWEEAWESINHGGHICMIARASAGHH